VWTGQRPAETGNIDTALGWGRRREREKPKPSEKKIMRWTERQSMVREGCVGQ